MVNIDEFVINLLLIHESKAVKQPVVLPLIMIADVIIALMIERKVKFSSIDPQEYYCKPSILHLLLIVANIIFCISFLFLVISDSVLGDAIFITVWYYCIDVYVFTYIYFNVPKRNYAIRCIKKIFTPSPRLIQIPLEWADHKTALHYYSPSQIFIPSTNLKVINCNSCIKIKKLYLW